MEEINENASKQESVKDKIKLGATIGGFIPFVSMPSKIIKAVVDNTPSGVKLSRTEVVKAFATGVIDYKLSNNNSLKNSFNSLDKISTNPNNSGYKNEFSNNVKNILNIYYNTYKPFVR